MINKKNTYINQPTQKLIRDLKLLISQKANFRENAAVIEEFERFKRLSKRTPEIIPFIENQLDPANDNVGLNKPQLEVLMAALLFRSSSTYSTIQHLVSQLNNIGLYDTAALINENAKGETGDKKHTPHSSLLFSSIYNMSEILKCTSLTESGYHMARHIVRLRRKDPEFAKGDINALPFAEQSKLFEDFKEKIRADGLMPCANGRSSFYTFLHAIHICNLIPASLANYHNEVLKLTQGLDEDRTSGAEATSSYDARRIATGILELAVREASSVDEFTTNRLSYIGTWGKVVDAYAGYAPAYGDYMKVAARKWSDVHNDEDQGKRLGWTSDAESGHAEDAAATATGILKGVSAEVFAQALHDVNHLMEARLEFWHDTVKRMKELEQAKEKIPLKPKPNKQSAVERFIFRPSSSFLPAL